MSRWSRYWFADGGRYALAILRVAIASAALLTLHELRQRWPIDAPGSPLWNGAYRPIGVWLVLGHHVPPPALVSALWLLAWIGTVMLLVGLATRFAAAVAFVAGVAIASLSYSAAPSWSHQYNVIYLALLAFQGARGGDALALDALIRRLRGLPAYDLARGYQWSIRLVQIAVAVMFASGMWTKIFQDHTLTLRWALSDNLRHQMLVRYDLKGLSRPPIVDWLIDDAWRFRTVAALNLISQILPLVACFMMKRPLVRAACGAFFAVETIGLGDVMQLWNLYWLPLVAVFVDWDALLARLRIIQAKPRDEDRAWRPPRGPFYFILAFVAYDAFAAFVPDMDQRLDSYPISRFPMFAVIRAREPYGEHLPYSVAGAKFELIADRPVDADWLEVSYPTIAQTRDAGELQKKLEGMLGHARARFPDANVRGVRVYLSIFETPAYPEPARFTAQHIALIGELDGADFRTLLGSSREADDQIEVRARPLGVDATGAQLAYFADDVPEPHPLAGWTFARGDLRGDPVDFVATAGGRTWLVESTRAYRK